MTHNVEPYLLDPRHQVTVNVIGVGGTGSQVLNILARMNVALKAWEHPGLMVYAWDGDEVTEANVGRQSFFSFDVGQNKAQNLISKINMAYGLNWMAYSRNYTSEENHANIYISCVDTVKARKIVLESFYREYAKHRPYEIPYYWLDFGNSSSFGQVVLADHKQNLKNIFELHPDMEIKEDPNEPSCSLAEALTKQELLINSTLANIGMNIIYQLFWNMGVEIQGAYLNLKDFSLATIPIPEK